MEKYQSDQNSLLISALEMNLELSYEQRIEAHENSRSLVNDLSEAGEKLRAGSEEAS